jgi:hypothetical protein
VTRLIRSELLKIRTVWSTWVLAGVVVLTTSGFGLLIAYAPRRRALRDLLVPSGSPRWFDGVFRPMGIAQTLALVVGVLIVTGEYRHKTVTPTLLAEPRRGRVTAAKLVVAATAGLTLGVITAVSGLGLGYLLVATGHGTAGIMLTEYRLVLPGDLGAAVLFALYGVGLGALLKSQVPALVSGLTFTIVVEPIVTGVLPTVGEYMPGQAAMALLGSAARSGGFGGGGSLQLLPWWGGVLVLLAYGVVLSVAGSLTTLRSDVT